MQVRSLFSLIGDSTKAVGYHTIERNIAGQRTNEKTGWENARITFKRAAQAIVANGNQQRSQESRKIVDLAKKTLAILSQDGSQ